MQPIPKPTPPPPHPTKVGSPVVLRTTSRRRRRAVTEGPAFHERFSDSEREALSKLEFASCVGRFYEDLAERLLNGAAEGFALAGVSEASVHEFAVPGAFELPQAAKLCAESGRFGGVACLGAVIRGETNHYEYVCAETARGAQDVALRTGIP